MKIRKKMMMMWWWWWKKKEEEEKEVDDKSWGERQGLKEEVGEEQEKAQISPHHFLPYKFEFVSP